VEEGVVKIVFVKTEGNLADSFTKSVGENTYNRNFVYLDKVCSDVEHHNKGECWDMISNISINEDFRMMEWNGYIVMWKVIWIDSEIWFEMYVLMKE